MHAFDILAEAKMRQWEQECREGDTGKKEVSRQPALDFSESLEKKLYRDIRETIIRAYMQTGQARERKLKDAETMQVQLNSRLERSGYNRVSRMFSENIHALKMRASAADRNELSPMLDALE